MCGEMSHVNGNLLENWLRAQSGISVLDLTELDIEDGVAATSAVNAVRVLCSRIALLRIVGAPQALAHTLYRTGMLEQGRIELKGMREDEAYG